MFNRLLSYNTISKSDKLSYNCMRYLSKYKKINMFNKINEIDNYNPNVKNDDNNHSLVKSRGLNKEKSKKLLQGLEPELKISQQLPSQAIETLKSIGEDYAEVITEALASPIFDGVFKGSKRADQAFDIEEVQTSHDYSHISVFWTCDILNRFTKTIYDRYGDVESDRFAKSTVEKINKKFQSKVPQVRAYLVKKMHFKRVPNITFKSYYPLLKPLIKI